MNTNNQAPELIQNSYSNRIKLISVSSLMLLAGSCLVSADVSTLDFDEGNGTSTFDQFSGVAGSGWASAWSTQMNSAAGASTSSSAVASSSPLYTGGGNYLQADFDTVSGLSTVPAVSLYREIDSGSIDLTAAVSYNFFYRTDSALADAGYQIFSRVGSSGVGTSANDTWEIFSDADSWRVRSGGTQIDTNVSISAGEVYEFSIVSDPTSQTWTVSIAGAGTNNYTSGSLNYRGTSSVEGEYLSFVLQDKDAANADSVYFSLDQVSVSSIPEPTTSAMLFGFVALALASVRKKRT